MDKLFTRISNATGSITAVFLAFSSVILWLLFGFFFQWTEMYLMIGTVFMSAISYVIPFIIQRSGNRDTRSIHLKLDELIRAIEQADNRYRHIETLSEKELKDIAGEK